MIFPFFEYLFGIKRRAFTFPACSSPLIGKKAKARFCLREYYFYCIRNFTFYILHLSFAQARGCQFCHPELVVTRLCCQHFAYWQNARLARRFLLFPKISLRCDFREPCFFREVERVSYVRSSVISTSSSHAYAVSILPFGKTLDLQGDSSSSQKSRFAAIFGSPV